MKVSHMSIVSFISIIGAVMITMIGVSITKPGMGHIDYTTDPSFHQAFLAVTNITFAYAGHVAFFSFISELKEPKDYPKALCLLQASDTTMYVVAAIVIYWYAGNQVASPALDSASTVVKKIAYGVATPTVKPPNLHPSTVACPPTDNRILDCCFGCYQWPCRLQIHLCPSPPRHRPHVEEVILLYRFMVPDRNRHVGHCLDHRRSHPSLQ